jgi:hypothetical protein
VGRWAFLTTVHVCLAVTGSSVTNAAVRKTDACRPPVRASDLAGTSRPRRTTDHMCGRRLMRVRARATTDPRCSTSVLRAGRDNFRDDRGDDRSACKSRSRLYLAFSPR